MTNQSYLLQTQSLEKTYTQGDSFITVLMDVTINIKTGSIIGLIGASGTGKSTLLHILGLLDTPSSGTLYHFGKSSTDLSEQEKNRFRAEKLGFIYQHHYLLSEFTALENVVLPQQILNILTKNEQYQYGKELLESVGLGHRLHHHPGKLSGGEKQRVAIARALANKPKLLLADEPTGNLDEKNAAHVFELLMGMVKSQGLTALIATHDIALAEKMDHILHLRDGILLQEK